MHTFGYWHVLPSSEGFPTNHINQKSNDDKYRCRQSVQKGYKGWLVTGGAACTVDSGHTFLLADLVQIHWKGWSCTQQKCCTAKAQLWRTSWQMSESWEMSEGWVTANYWSLYRICIIFINWSLSHIYYVWALENLQQYMYSSSSHRTWYVEDLDGISWLLAIANTKFNQ